MPDFEINTHEIGGDITVVNVIGFLDAHTFEYMENTIERLFQDGRYRIVINLGDVDYISSAGAGVFIGSYQAAADKGGAIVLLNPSDSVKEVFDLLGLSQLFTFVTSEAGAIKFFRDNGM